MSYNITLAYPDGEVAKVDNHQVGATFCLGGTTFANLKITGNYSKYYGEHLDKDKGARWLYGKKAGDTIARLEKAIEVLGTTRDSNYWKPTPGNAGHTLSILLKWAKQHPEATWES